MSELNAITKQLQAMMPHWFVMAKDDESVGAKFLDVFGVEFADVQKYLDQVVSSVHLPTADVSQIDITYKVPLALPEVIDMQEVHSIAAGKDGVIYPVHVKTNLAEFYMSDPDANTAILDRTDGLIYIRPSSAIMDASIHKPFDYVEIDGVAHYDITLHHIWNPFDEFGLLLGLNRLYGERNAAFKERILDVFLNPGGSNRNGILNGLSRELGIDKNRIRINEMTDVAFKNSLLNSDGSPSKKLVEYAQRINKTLGFTWNNMSWGEAYWKTIQDANVGFDYLPHLWDVSTEMWTNEDFQSGVGDENDLLVIAPKEQSNIRNFKYFVGLRGAIKTGKLSYPAHSFKYSIKAKGKILNQEAKPQNYKYTVVSSEIIYLYFLIRAFQEYTYNETFDFTDTSGIQFDNETSPSLEIVDASTVMSNKSDPYLEVETYMRTDSNSETPVLEKLDVSWLDTANQKHTLIFDSQADFDRNDAIVSVSKENTITNAEGGVELGFGDFYHVIDSKGDFNKGTLFNTEVIDRGSVKLIQPKI